MLFLLLTTDFPGGSAGKESAYNVGDLCLIPGLGRCPGEGKGYQLQYSGLENSMDSIVHGVTESDMTERLSLGNSLAAQWLGLCAFTAEHMLCDVAKKILSL